MVYSTIGLRFVPPLSNQQYKSILKLVMILNLPHIYTIMYYVYHNVYYNTQYTTPTFNTKNNTLCIRRIMRIMSMSTLIPFTLPAIYTPKASAHKPSQCHLFHFLACQAVVFLPVYVDNETYIYLHSHCMPVLLPSPQQHALTQSSWYRYKGTTYRRCSFIIMCL